MRIGPYELIEEIGRGGMAQVWLARRVWGNGKRKAVVIKFPCKEAVLSEALLRQFEQEVRLSLELQHDNIVHAFDTGYHEGLPYLVMEYVPGCNLLKLIRAASEAGQIWDVNMAVHIVREVAHALAYAHSTTIDGMAQRVVHRDVASKNVLVSLSGGVLLSDFGVAASIATHTTRQHVKGTLAYMAPEHYLSNACPASDAFGLGAIFWELLEGRSFRGEVAESEMRATVVAGTVPRLTRDVPPVVRRVVEGLLRADVLARMRLSEVLVLLTDDAFPDRRIQLARRVVHFVGDGVHASGLSKAHFTASPELVQTFAAVKAAGVPRVELGTPVAPISIRSKIPSDFAPQPAARTADHGPPSERAALEDTEAASEWPSAAEPGAGASTLVLGRPGPSPGEPVVQPRTVVLAAPRPGAAGGVAPTDRLPRPDEASPVQELGREEVGAPAPHRPWVSSPPLAPTDSDVVEHTDAHAVATAAPSPRARRRPSPWLGAAAGVVATLLAVLLGVQLFGESATSSTASNEVALAEGPASPVAAAPTAARAEDVDEVEPLVLREPDVGSVAVSAAAAPSNDPRQSDEAPDVVDPQPTATTPSPGAEAPEAPSEPEPSAETPPPAEPKARVERAVLDVKRGDPDYGEIRIGSGKAHQIPYRGGITLKVPVGRRTVRWRTSPDVPWRSMTYTFERGMIHTFVLWNDRIGNAKTPKGPAN